MALTVWAVPGREGEAMVARPFGIGMVDMTVDFDRPLTGVISAVLQSCLSSAEGTSWTGADLAEWTIPRQRQGLLAVAVATNGARRVFETACGECGEKLDVEVDLTMFRQDWSVEETGFGGGRLRLPRAGDLARSGGDPVALADLLLEGEAPGGDWREEAEEVLAELDPLSDVELRSTCPDCGADVAMPLSLEMELVTELAREPQRLMDEIHMIAMAYNWSEREIISLPDSRRRHYLARIREAWAA